MMTCHQHLVARQHPASRSLIRISIWLEKFSIMAAILCTRFLEKAPELLAYQASIIRAERNYEGKQWAYDRQFRREALARKDVLDPRLYNEASTGWARAIARCLFCLQDDHVTNTCPHNPNQPMYSWSSSSLTWLSHQTLAHHSTGPLAQEICRRYNEGGVGKQAADIAMFVAVARNPTRWWTAPRRARVMLPPVAAPPGDHETECPPRAQLAEATDGTYIYLSTHPVQSHIG